MQPGGHAGGRGRSGVSGDASSSRSWIRNESSRLMGAVAAAKYGL